MSNVDRSLSLAAADHPDYLPPPPRPATLNARAVWTRVGLLAGLVLAPPLVLYLGEISAANLRTLIGRGRTATGAIVPRGRRTCPPSRFGSSSIDFTFTVNGTTFRGRESLSAQSQAACIHGRACTVTYLPRDPNIHCLGSAELLLQSHNRAVNYITLALSLAFAFLLLFLEIRARRELRLASDGEVTEGRIIEKTTSTGKNRTTYWVRYRIDTPDQQRRTGWVRIGPLLWEDLHYGALIAVLYDPERPSRHCPSFGLRYVRFLAGAAEPRP